MKKILTLLSVLIFLSSCTTLETITPYKSVELIPLKYFCQENNLKYSYTPFYEEIKLEGKNFLAYIKTGYNYAMVNGEVIDLQKKVGYFNGNVQVPSSLKVKAKTRRSPVKMPKVLRKKRYIRRVVIDAGHGGKDPGAISKRGVREKKINLRVAKYLYEQLRKKGYKVYMTRNTDEFISLQGRTDFTKKKNADLFISIHSNAIGKSSIRGLEVYYVSSNYTDRQARELAKSEKMGDIKNLRNASYDVRQKVGKLLNKENRRYTLEFSSTILKTAERMGIKTRSAKGAPFYVLKNNICPAVLVELGYLTNPKEERLLTLPLYQKQLASCLSFAVDKLDNYMAKTSRVKYVSK